MLTIVFFDAAVKNVTTVTEQASMDVRKEAYLLQEKVDEIFPRDAHPVPFEVYGEGESANILTKEVLLALYQKEEALRGSALGGKYLLNVRDPLLGGEIPVEGMYTIADAVEGVLRAEGTTLARASEEQVTHAVELVLDDPRQGAFFRASLSNKSSYQDGMRVSPALAFFVYTDNELSGGGVFRRTVDSSHGTLRKETLNRTIEQRLALEVPDTHLRGIGIDLNIEADEEAFSPGVLARNGGLMIGLALLCALLFRSVRVFIVALAGLFVLLVWILGFPIVAEKVVRPSVMTDMIIPLAFMVLGIDFFVYAVNRYRREAQKRSRDPLFAGFAAVGGALVLAMISDAIAFAANYISGVEAVRAFAVTGVFGAAAAFFIMGVAAPIALAQWEKGRLPRRSSLKIHAGIIGNILQFFYRFKGSATVLVIMGTSVAAFFISDIEKRLDPKDFVSPSSHFVESLDVRDAHWGDSRGEETIIYVRGDLRSPEGQEAVDAMLANIRGNPHLARTSEEGRLVMPYGAPEIREAGQDEYALQVVVEAVGTRELENVQTARRALAEDLRPLAKAEGTILEYGITGPAFTRLESLEAVTEALAGTVFTAALLILILLALVYRSLRFALITIAPMLFVVVWTYGLMGHLGLALNFITATIAAVSLGVGIDYAVHIVHSYRQHRRAMQSPEEALMSVGRGTGFAAFVAALTSIGGFAVLATAPMPLFATYGVLGIAMIAFSFLAAFVILPPLFAWAKV